MPSHRSWTSSLRWCLQTAFRDARGSAGKALVYALSMALGIAALVAMGSLGADLEKAIHEQAKSLVGADLIFSSRQPFTPESEAFFDGIQGESARLTRFASMAYFPKKDRAVLARIRAVEGPYPFYGRLETEPVHARDSYRDGPLALVESSLMERMGAATGDPIRVGDKEFRIVGRLLSTSGEPPATSIMGPRIIISGRFLDATGLIQPGSRVFYSQAFKLDMDPDRLVREHQSFLRQQRLRWDTVFTRRESLGQVMGNLTHFLNLVACLALLLGGLGVAGAVHQHIGQKTKQMAVLRCLGATTSQVMAVFLFQVMGMALISVFLGSLIGAGIHYFLPHLIAELLPFEFRPTLQWRAIAIANGWGLLMSLLLAFSPLIAIRRISPLLCFRPDLEPQGRDWLQAAGYAVGAMTWWLFAVVQMRSALHGTWFMMGLLLALSGLHLTARLLTWSARRFLSPRLPFAWRHGLANLLRPFRQTSVFLIILGLGTFLVIILAGSRSILLGRFQTAITQDKPNFFAFDIQIDQLEEVRNLVAALDFHAGPPTPLVPMRLSALKGQPVSQLLGGSIPEWALRREYRSTYKDALGANEKLTRGHWIARGSIDREPVPISMEAGIAEALQIDLDDVLTVDILGLPLKLKVTSIREVDWQSMQPNFYMLFPTGVLEEVPQMFLLTTQTRDPAQVALLQKELAKAFPNVSSIDLTQFLASIEKLLSKAAAVVRFLASLCLLTGFILLAATIWNGRYQRLGEHALLRTLGATQKQMAHTALVEYFLLGLFAATAGLILALIALSVLGHFLFGGFSLPHPAAVLLPFAALPLMTLLLGYLSMRPVWRVPPRDLLRRESL